MTISQGERSDTEENDSDSDGFPDTWEEFLGTDPFDPNEMPEDTDNDTAPDGDVGNTQSWMDADDDNDAMPDYWELQNSFNPKNASDSMLDVDGDGFSNLNEYLKDTNPHDELDYPTQPTTQPRTKEQDWSGFMFLLIISVIVMMIISTIIGKTIIDKRRKEEEFWVQTFGDMGVSGADNGVDKEARERYQSWVRDIEAGKSGKPLRKPKYELEIIGGPEEVLDQRHDTISIHKKTSKKKGGIRGRTCLWCDSGITGKYIKRCLGLRSPGNPCRDGPFCSKRCLEEHLDTVPHFKRVNF